MPPRVLIVRLGAMGDVVHALPAVAMLRSALPEAHIGWVVEQRWRELLCAPGTELAGPRVPGRPLLDELHLVDTRAWRKRPFSPAVQSEFLSAIRRLRLRQYDFALDFQGAIKSALLARLSGAGLIFGFRQPRESQARWLYARSVKTHAAHVIDQNKELVQAALQHMHLSPDTAILPPGAALLPSDPLSEARISSILDTRSLARTPIAILNPGAGWAAKQWAPARYAELAGRLSECGLPSVINYGPGEKDLAEEVAAASNGRALALPTTLGEFIALARRAHLIVGGDTGPMHIAALLGVNTVALFGPTDPARNGPYWPATRILRDPASVTSYSHKRTTDSGLEKLTVEHVLAEIDSLLA
ncbi:MAG: glycosyltransferase family 9 protein [Candidatus Korobacteraceae bacterium]